MRTACLVLSCPHKPNSPKKERRPPGQINRSAAIYKRLFHSANIPVAPPSAQSAKAEAVRIPCPNGTRGTPCLVTPFACPSEMPTHRSKCAPGTAAGRKSAADPLLPAFRKVCEPTAFLQRSRTVRLFRNHGKATNAGKRRNRTCTAHFGKRRQTELPVPGNATGGKAFSQDSFITPVKG